MQKWYKIIPMVLACIMGGVIFYMLGTDPSHITKKDLSKLQTSNPKMEVARIDQGTLVQIEAYGKPAEHRLRVQAQRPGNAIFYDAEGKPIMKMFLEAGDIVINVPNQKTVDAVGFEPFDWVE